MHLDHKQLGLILVGAAFAGLLFYVAYDQSDKGQARYQSPKGFAVGLGFVAIDALDTGDHYFHPAYCVPGQTQIFTAHKYPEVSGGEISTLIHQGMDALRRPAPQDDDWRTMPPAEVMWL